LRRCTARQTLDRDGLRRRDELAARVVHEHVNPAEPIQDGVDDRGDLVGFADVGPGHGQDLGARRRELERHLLEGFGPPAGDGDAGAGPGVLARDRSSETGSAAGHERDETLVRVGSEGGTVVLGHARHDGTRAFVLPAP